MNMGDGVTEEVGEGDSEAEGVGLAVRVTVRVGVTDREGEHVIVPVGDAEGEGVCDGVKDVEGDGEEEGAIQLPRNSALEQMYGTLALLAFAMATQACHLSSKYSQIETFIRTTLGNTSICEVHRPTTAVEGERVRVIKKESWTSGTHLDNSCCRLLKPAWIAPHPPP